MDRRATALALTAIALAVAALYAHTLPYDFVFDDHLNFLDNSDIRSIDRMYMTPQGAPPALVNPVYYHHYRVRALPYLSYWLNYQVGGYARAWQWRAVNIALHMAMCSLVYAFVLMAFRMPRMRGAWDGGRARGAALASALIYAVHPLQTETVIYISGRVGEIAAALYMCSVAAYMWWRTSGNRAAPWLSAAAGLMAMFSKETAFTLPLMILLIEWTLGGEPRRALWWLALLPVIPAAKLTVLGSSLSLDGTVVSGSRLLSDAPRLHYLYTQASVVLRYIQLTLLPAGQCADYTWPLAASPFAPNVVLPALLLAAALGAGAYALKRSEGNPALRLSALGVFGFFLALSVESSVFPIIIVIAEYRTYLPLAFLIPALVAAAAITLKPSARKPAAAIVIALLAAAAFERSAVWRSELALWSDVSAKMPGNIRALTDLGIAYESAGGTRRAIEQYEAILKISPDEAHVLNNLGSAYVKTGEPWKAVEHFKKALAITPGAARVHFNLGNAYAAMSRYDKAIESYENVLDITPGHTGALNNMGMSYQSLGQYDSALAVFSRLLELEPGSALALYNIGTTFALRGDLDNAARYLDAALSAEPDNTGALVGLGDVRLRQKRYDDARRLFQRAIALAPSSAPALKGLEALDKIKSAE